MNTLWKPVSNFTKGREHNLTPKAIVIHIGEGSQNIIYQTFLTEPKSSHYCVSRKGEIWQFVSEQDTAWHAGYVVSPRAEILNQFPYNPNSYTLGIEAEGYADQEPTPEYYKSCAELVKMLCAKYKIPLHADYIIPHRAIRKDKTCPGRISCGKIIDLAQAPVPIPQIQPITPTYAPQIQPNVSIPEWLKNFLYRNKKV